MKPWPEYLTQDAVLRLLCKWRARLARKRAPLQRLWMVVDGLDDPTGKNPAAHIIADLANDVTVVENGIGVFLPPRRKWVRPGGKERKRLGEDKVLETSIFRTAKRDLEKEFCDGEQPIWIDNLKQLQRNVDSLRNSPVVKFHEPTIHLIPKGTGNARRCLASFDIVPERVLLSQAALYLRDVFDPLLSADCFSFRRDGAFSYRSALDDLIRYRMAHSGKRLYVAECDIQSFFDVIDQRIVLEAYDRCVGRLSESERPPEQLRNILVGYLSAFTSRGNLAASTDPKIIEYRHLVKPLEETDVYDFYPGEARNGLRLGIPQGGALSPLIANLVLDAADQAVRDVDDPELLYIRFCDDIIIVHPDKDKCRAALERYMGALKALRLPAHPVREDVVFGRDYYEEKSKGPFPWCEIDAGTNKGIPWVAFLGVHIHYDGQVRVRKDSLDRHGKKLRGELKRYKEAVGKNGVNLKDTSTAAKESLLRSFEARIVAMGTGYSTMRLTDIGKQCWMAAFPFLTADGPARGQMRHLDCVRGHQVAALRKQLGLAPGRRETGPKGFYGRPYSYFGALMDVERHHSFPSANDSWIYSNM